MTPDERYFTPRQTAHYLGLAFGTLANMRMRGDGPPFIALSPRAIRYEKEELKMWLTNRRRVSTSDLAPGPF